MATSQVPDGFIYQSPPSTATSNTPILSYHTLPHPRSSGPLKSGSRSESNLITYLDDQLLQVSRKYTKKYHDGGYDTIEAVVEDLERLVDILWVSSTPTLQTYYLLQMANSFNDYLASFPPQLKATLRLLDTFDRCLYTLITGTPADPPMLLTPPISSYKMGITEKVRLKSIIERTRLHIVKLVEQSIPVPGPSAENSSGRVGDGMDIETGGESDINNDHPEDEELEIEVAKVYGRSLMQIGESLKEG